MGLINNQDQRPRDWAYMVRFDRKDLPSLQEMARHIRETHDTDMIESFNARCEQKLSGINTELDNGIEIQSVTKTGDLVVNPGLQQCLNIILGTSSARWSHFGMGNSTASATVADTALFTETIATRVSLAWNEPVGMKLFFGGISSQTTGTNPTPVSEIGVYNSASAGAILLNHSTFIDSISQAAIFSSLVPVSPAPIIVSAVIEFCPVV